MRFERVLRILEPQNSTRSGAVLQQERAHGVGLLALEVVLRNVEALPATACRAARRRELLGGCWRSLHVACQVSQGAFGSVLHPRRGTVRILDRCFEPFGAVLVLFVLV